MTDFQALWKSRLGEEEKPSRVLRQSMTLYTWMLWKTACGWQKKLNVGREEAKRAWAMGKQWETPYVLRLTCTALD